MGSRLRSAGQGSRSKTVVTIEQKQVLKAQKEAIKKRKEVESQDQPLIEPQSKRPRGLLPGMKGNLQQMKMRTETRKSSG